MERSVHSYNPNQIPLQPFTKMFNLGISSWLDLTPMWKNICWPLSLLVNIFRRAPILTHLGIFQFVASTDMHMTQFLFLELWATWLKNSQKHHYTSWPVVIIVLESFYISFYWCQNLSARWPIINSKNNEFAFLFAAMQEPSWGCKNHVTVTWLQSW